MNKKRKVYINRYIEKIKHRREMLIIVMGGKCRLCGRTEDLEFDHPNGRTWKAEKKNKWNRQIAYEHDYEKGLLRLLCSDCNKRNIPGVLRGLNISRGGK